LPDESDFYEEAAMSELANTLTLPPTPERLRREIGALEAWTSQLEQSEIATEHVFHAGMYLRTIRVPREILLTGALMKRATAVIVGGHALMLAGEEWVELDGYTVLPASAGRKQVFLSLTEMWITMVFPTRATTVADAEAEFTDESALLLSRRQSRNRVVWTGE
jgi:hypothetical protein